MIYVHLIEDALLLVYLQAHFGGTSSPFCRRQEPIVVLIHRLEGQHWIAKVLEAAFHDLVRAHAKGFGKIV